MMKTRCPVRRGATLLWTATAMLALAITITTAASAFFQLARLGRRNSDRLIALQAGERELARLRAGKAPAVGRHDLGRCAGLAEGRALPEVRPDANRRLRVARLEVCWRDPEGPRRMVWTTLVKP